MPLDAQNAALVKYFADIWGDGPFDLAAFRKAASPPPRLGAGRVGPRCEDRDIPGPLGVIPIRIYRPRDAAAKGALVYFHGGGFVSGGLETADEVCRALTELATCVTISVDYRLAPEHRFPAGVEDAYAAVQWVISAIGEFNAPSCVAVGGDSAGGTMATMACQMARDRGAPAPMFQLLFYPGINLDVDTPERTALGRKGYILTPELIQWLNGFYCASPADFEQPYCTPVRSRNLSGLPPALLIAGDCDPICYETAAYAERLRAAGVPATYSEYEGAAHGFVSGFTWIDQGRRALDEAANALRRAFATAAGA